MIKDPYFKKCGFVRPYFSITAQRPDELILTFERGKK